MLCKICGSEFEFTQGEQTFYKDRGLDPPKRCPECRVKKRREEKRREKERVFQSPQ